MQRCGRLGFDFTLARAHFTLGLALRRLAEPERAEQALLTALRFAPGLAAAHRLLSRWHRQDGNTHLANLHMMQSAQILKNRERKEPRLAEIRRQSKLRKLERTCAEESLPTNKTDQPSSVAPPRSDTRQPAIQKGHEFLVVSGLPRSGTSLMMQMLQAAGVPLMIDGVRTADEHNAEGYFEWAACVRLRQEPELLEQAAGKAIKIVSILIPSLPVRHRYKVLLMRRPVLEVARSQLVMRHGRTPKLADVEKTAAVLEKHLQATLEILRMSPQVELLEVDYPALVDRAELVVPNLATFIGASRTPCANAMWKVVRPDLRHQVSP